MRKPMRIAIPIPSTDPAIASQKRAPSPSSSAETERAIAPEPWAPGGGPPSPGGGDSRSPGVRRGSAARGDRTREEERDEREPDPGLRGGLRQRDGGRRGAGRRAGDGQGRLDRPHRRRRDRAHARRQGEVPRDGGRGPA